MGTSKQMVDMYRAGNLVWVLRQHGTWWPGRIVGPIDIPPPFKDRFQCSMSSSELPIMLIGRSSSSLDWYNRKSKRVKPFRCSEFDNCIKEAESCEASICFNGGVDVDTRRCARLKDAILHALAIEKKERQTKLKRPGDAQLETVCRAKKLKSTIAVVKSAARPEHTPTEVQIKSASSENLPRSSITDHKNTAENSDHSQRKLRSVTVKKQGQSINWPQSPNCHTGGITNQNEKQKGKGDHCNRRDVSTNPKRFTLGKCRQVMADPLAPDDTSVGVKQIFVTEAAENTNINSIHSAHTIQQKGTQITLVDVDEIVQNFNRVEHVPFKCMISKTSQKPIIGHPVDIEVVADSSGIFLGKTDGISGSLFGHAGDKISKLVWRTAKRTPVCYSSTSEGPNTSVATQSFSDSKAKGRGHPRMPESPVNNLTKHTISADHTLLHAVKNQAVVNAISRVNCIPVKHIFGRLFTAVG